MTVAMREVKELINHLPDDTEIEDVQYHLYVLEMIRKGQDDIQEGRHYSTTQVREHLKKWLEL